MDTKYLYAALVKAEKQADGTMLVSGPVSTSALDRDQQVCDDAWLDAAVPTWFGEGGNIREQHSHIAAGKALEYWKAEDGKHWVQARVVDPASVTKVEHQVLTGFSIGIKGARVVKDAVAPGGRIVDGKIIEVSLVDRPANPECLLTLAKSDEAGVIEVVEDQSLTLAGPEDQQPETDAAPVVSDTVAERPVVSDTVARINALAAEAVAAVTGKADEPEEPTEVVSEHEAVISSAADEVRAQAQGVLDVLASLDLPPWAKADEASDITDAQQAISIVARLIQSEAEGLAAGEMNEAYDIELLLRAIDALRFFISSERFEAAEDATLELSDEPDTASEQQPAEDVSKGEGVALTKADTDSLMEALTVKFEGIVAEALAKAEESHKAETSALRDELAKVKAQPSAGGPVRVRVNADQVKAIETDRRSLIEQADAYMAKADAATDHEVADGYRAIARDLRAKADR